MLKNNILEKFKGIKLGQREDKPYLLNHSKCKYNKYSTREKDTCRKMVLKREKLEMPEIRKELGEPFDFQVPLKNKQKEKYGEIDLLTYRKEEKCIYMVEAKSVRSTETALRAILEIATYYSLLGKEGRKKIKKEFNENKKRYNLEKYPDAEEIKKAVLFFEGTTPAKDIKNISEVKTLAKELDIKVVVEDGEEFMPNS